MAVHPHVLVPLDVFSQSLCHKTGETQDLKFSLTHFLDFLFIQVRYGCHRLIQHINFLAGIFSG